MTRARSLWPARSVPEIARATQITHREVYRRLGYTPRTEHLERGDRAAALHRGGMGYTEVGRVIGCSRQSAYQMVAARRGRTTAQETA